MARNKVMKLWTAIVTAFLALCTALGFITTTASAAVPPDRDDAQQRERPGHDGAGDVRPALVPCEGPAPHDETAHPRGGPWRLSPLPPPLAREPGPGL
ncbi:hypothetical protein SHIRM173S_04555 [Streptomyces hirsutus]